MIALAHQHAALVRNDLGGLEPRRFATPAEAARVSQARELPLPPAAEVAAVMGWRGRREMRHTEFAERLGVSTRMVRAQFKRGGLPGAKEHSAYVLMVPTHLLRLAQMYGLRRVEKMAAAGLLTAEGVVAN